MRAQKKTLSYSNATKNNAPEFTRARRISPKNRQTGSIDTAHLYLTPPVETDVKGIIEELNQIISDKQDLLNDGVQLKESSVNLAITFTNTVLVHANFKPPEIQLFPGGEVSFTWRDNNKGIINILFNEHNTLSYVCYFYHVDGNTTIKGEIKSFNSTSTNMASLTDSIKRING